MPPRLLLLSLLLLSVYSVGHSRLVPRPDTVLAPKRPVIIDTDIGSFIDDTFAIVYAALSPDLDIKLVVTCTDDTTARAKVAAKLLDAIGRNDIPIGIGIKNENKTSHSLFDWAIMENLTNYRGGVYSDGIGKMAEFIADSPIPVDIIAIGPMTNFPTLIQKYPGTMKNSRIMAMGGSINRGYYGSLVPAEEYNVALCPWCFESLLQAGWDVTIAPLDICGTLRLDNYELQELLEAYQPSSLALASSLLFFCLTTTIDKCDLRNIGSPILYDVVATLLSLPGAAEEFVEFIDMKLSVNGTGFTVEDQISGTPTRVALSWKDKAEFTKYLIRLMTQVP